MKEVVPIQFKIRPYEGVGSVSFGMSRSEVRRKLESSVEAFRKSSLSKTDADAFDALGIHVHYKESDDCEAVELASPSEPLFQGRQLVGKPFDELRDWLASLDENLEVDESGLTSYKHGIGLFAPFAADSPSEPVESVIVFEKGYFD